MEKTNVLENAALKKLTPLERQCINGHKGAVIWLTGLSASGKSTLAIELDRSLTSQNIRSFVLDGDSIRKGLCADLGFSSEDRKENIRRIGEVAKLFSEACTIAIVAFISPYKADRDHVRELMRDDHFVEIFVDCSIEECERRDPKGLYSKARRGEIENFTGVSAPYEKPVNPEIHLRTDQKSIKECITEVMDFLHNNKVIGIN